jgi:hypothetical protein
MTKQNIKKTELINKKQKKDILVFDNKNINFVLVEKSGDLKDILFNDFNIEELYKKCGFRKKDNFLCKTVWSDIKVGKYKYTIELWAKDDGKSNTENKYDFPPPIDKELYFGNCALLQVNKKNNLENNKSCNKYCSLNKDLWIKIYETLFGGFDDLKDTYENDQNEQDELLDVKKELKTKNTGYLKDGFVVDSDEELSSIEDIESIEEESDKSCDTDKSSDTDDEISDDNDINSDVEENDYEDDATNVDNIKNKKYNKTNIKCKKNKKIEKPLEEIYSEIIKQTNDIYIDDNISNGSELTAEDYEYDD